MKSSAQIGRDAGLALPLLNCIPLELPMESQVVLRKLTSVLMPPVDAPALLTVLESAEQAVDAYRKTLRNPTTLLKEISRGLSSLNEWCVRYSRSSCATSDDPMRRRLLKKSAWALFIEISKAQLPEILRVAAGVELAYSLATNKSFPNGYAAKLRRAIEVSVDVLSIDKGTDAGEEPWLPHFRKVTRDAQRLFESDMLPQEVDQKSSFSEIAIKALRGASLAPEIRHRQGVLDHSHLPLASIVVAAKSLRIRVENGNDDAMLSLLAFLCGLPLRLAIWMPLAGTSDNWVVALDAESGILRTDTGLVYTNAARPRNSSAHRPASRVIAKPLPLFLAAAFLARLNENPNARCVADLLSAATCDGGQLAVPEENLGLKPSIARFIHSAAAAAIHLGIDRLSAAVLVNDFGVIPASKVYYCHLDRRDVWRAASTFYDVLGWGSPASITEGLPFGSQVVPTRGAIQAWHQWVRDRLEKLHPGKNCRIETLLAFHNHYAEACAALIVFCLGARETARIEITADALTERAESVLLFDKRVGNLPRPLPVPVNALIRTQMHFYRGHCQALEKRYGRKGVAIDSEVRQRLMRIACADRVELFFRIDEKLRLEPISSHQLVKSLPREFGFESDFGRHFWESELHLAGVKSSVIDLLLRHQVSGIDSHQSTSSRSLASAFSEITQAQEALLDGLGVEPLQGLAKT